MIKIVFFDIDGTIYLNKESRIVDSTLFAIRELRKRGIKVCVCTSRSIDEMIKLPKFIFEEMDGMVTSGGAEMYLDNKLVKHFPIKHDVITKVINVLEEGHAIYRYSGLNHINYLSERNEYVDSVFYSLYSMVPEKKKYEGEEVNHLLFYCATPELKKKVLDCLENEVYTDLKVVNELVAEGVEKASAMKRYAKEIFNINEDEIMAFGDGENDAVMVKEAAIGVAMGNGCNEVKEVANYITDNIENDGIYKALKYFELID